MARARGGGAQGAGPGAAGEPGPLAAAARRWLRRALLGLGLPAALLLVLGGIGALLPREHELRRSAVLEAERGVLWAIIADFERMPGWLPGVQRIQRLEQRSGRPRWREHSRFGECVYEVLQSEPPRRLVARIEEVGGAFGRTWTWQLEALAEGRTRLTITEEGWIANPLLRFVVRVVLGQARTLERYLEALRGRVAAVRAGPAAPAPRPDPGAG